MQDNKLDVEETVVAENTTDNKATVRKEPFFKSVTFKCISALLCVLLVCGVFLTIMNGLLEVTPEERFERAIIKIYGKSVKADSVPVANYNDNANIEEAYKMGDGNYLVKATGYGGFDNGTVTCWVVVELKGTSLDGIGKVIIDSNKGQSYINRVSAAALNQFGELYEDGIYYTEDLITAATVKATKTAICNAVNGAMDFVNGIFGNVADDPYKDFDYITNIQTKQSSHVYNKEDGSVTFTVVSKGYGMAGDFTSLVTVDKNGRMTAFEIVKSGSTSDTYTTKAMENVNNVFMGKNLEEMLAIFQFGADAEITYPGDGKFPTTGASNSSYSLYNAALFAVANYKNIPEYTPVEDTPVVDDNVQGGDENE